MTSSEIRQSFLDFFKSKQHTVVPSSSLLPDSPNLLFTNAGMNQFVPIFLGQVKCPYTPGRTADTQKCIRAGGKHNDLEDVGLDTYHHTFFEMLGNWSFGDYFKKEAIEWAWELITEVWKFPKNRLYATVYQPGEGDPSEFDQEAYDHWARLFSAAGLDPKVHIRTGGKKDNFWMMGETGPCGPCSELHVDLTQNGDTRGALVNKGCSECIEIWNLVFIQFNANADGTFSPLPSRHVDTGMGFERVTSILQCTKNFTNFRAVISNYETDIFRPIFDKLEQLSGKRYASTLPNTTGSTGNLPVPPGNLPGGMGGTNALPNDAGLQEGSLPHSAGLVAQRDGQVARATRERDGQVARATPFAPGATYFRRNLPHFEKPWAIYHVIINTIAPRTLSPAARDIVFDCILHWRDTRYRLVAACVMPDHAHLIIQPGVKEEDKDGKPVFWPLTEILHSIKSYSANEVNKLESVKGTLWQAERYDRYMRSDADLQEKFHYICRNPWAAGLVQENEPWPWLWTPDIEAWNPYVPLKLRMGSTGKSSMGSTGNLPVPPGNLPGGMGGTNALPNEAGAQEGSRSHSAGLVAQRDGQVARATREQIATDVAFRVIADHIRTLSFAIADGIQPGNTDRNYVLRRILRRAVRYGRTLGFHEPFFYRLVDVLAESMGDVFPEIRAKQKHVEEVIRVEEEAFNKTLDRGLQFFEDYTLQARAVARRMGGEPVFDGEWAFTLYDTYGFPYDLTELLARERGMPLDKPAFETFMDLQKQRARAAQKKTVIELSQIETQTPTTFIGYDKLETPAKVLEVVSLKDKTAIILDTSACYAEMGGQVGDTGELEHGAQLWRITNTQKSGNTWLHFLESEISDRKSQIADAAETAALPLPGAEVLLTVDRDRRNAIQRHHTVTHLLHWALHEVVSGDASQKGSFVGPDKLTFDFNHAPLTPQQVADVEKLVNERILENAPVTWMEVKYDHVKGRADVMQFFGDKYGEWVRVVQIGGKPTRLDGYSMELCGGTHTRATGEIGLFRITGENAIAAGVRRIEAIAGLTAYDVMKLDRELVRAVAGKVNSPIHELDKKIESLLEQQKALEKQLRAMQQKEAAGAARNLASKAETINGIPAIIERFDADGDTLQGMVNELKGQFKGVIVLAGAANNAVALVASVSPEFTAKVQAGKIIQQIAPIVGGKGGGKPDNARGGGKDVTKLDEALARAKSLLG